MAIHVVAVEQRNEPFLMGPLPAQGPRHAACLHLMSLPRETVVENADGGHEVFFYCRSGLKKQCLTLFTVAPNWSVPEINKSLFAGCPRLFTKGGGESKEPSEKRWKNWLSNLCLPSGEGSRLMLVCALL